MAKTSKNTSNSGKGKGKGKNGTNSLPAVTNSPMTYSLEQLPECVGQYDRKNAIGLSGSKVILEMSSRDIYAKYDYTAIEKRIRYAILYLAKSEIELGNGVNTILGRVDYDTRQQRFLTIPINVLMSSSKSHNYDIVRDAVVSFGRKNYEVSDGKGGWIGVFPITAYYVRAVEGMVILKIDYDIWNAICTESSPYTEVDILQAMQFSSPLTMRLYEISSNLKTATLFDIDYLRKMFCMEEKYTNNGDLIRALERAIKGMEGSDIGMELSKKNEKPITKLTLTPVYNSNLKTREKEIKDQLKKFGLNWIINPRDMRALLECGFDKDGLVANITTIKIAIDILNRGNYQRDGLVKFLTKIISWSENNNINNLPGLVIEKMKELVTKYYE